MILFSGRLVGHPLLGAEFWHYSLGESESDYIKVVNLIKSPHQEAHTIEGFSGRVFILEECLFCPSDESDVLVDYYTMMQIINKESG